MNVIQGQDIDDILENDNLDGGGELIEKYISSNIYDEMVYNNGYLRLAREKIDKILN